MGGVDSKFEAPVWTGPYFKSSQVDSPGTYDNLARKCRELFPEQFEGLQLKLAKSFAKDHKESLTLNLFSGGDSLSLNPETSFCHGWTSSWSGYGGDSSLQSRHKVLLQVLNNQRATTRIGFDFRGDGITTTAKLSVSSSSPATGKLQLLKEISAGFCVGSELVFGGDSSSLTLSGRLTSKDEYAILTSYLGTNSFGMTYYEQLNSGWSSVQTHLGLQMEVNTTSGERRIAVASRFYNPVTKYTSDLMFDSSGTLASLVEVPLTSIPINLSSCLSLNVFNANFHVGLGFSSSS